MVSFRHFQSYKQSLFFFFLCVLIISLPSVFMHFAPFHFLMVSYLILLALYISIIFVVYIACFVTWTSVTSLFLYLFSISAVRVIVYFVHVDVRWFFLILLSLSLVFVILLHLNYIYSVSFYIAKSLVSIFGLVFRMCLHWF